MSEKETGSKAHRVLPRWSWVILLLLYVATSIIYQSFVFPFLPGETERYHLETDCFIVEIRFPLVLTVANQPGGEVSQPASFWVWKNPNPNAAVCDPEARIAISHDTLDLVWLEEKQEVSASWLLPVSNLRKEAKPHRTFVYLAPQENLPSRAGLTVLVNQIKVDQIQNSDGTNLTAIPVNLWSASASGWFRLANLLLGSQNLTLLASILTVVGGIYKLFNDEQERRKQQQKEFDTALAEFEQRATQQPEQIANEYLDLLTKNKKSGISSPQQEQLKRKFKDFARQFPQGHIWARGLRLRLAEDLKFLQQDSEKQSAGTEQASRRSELIAWLENAQKETEFLSDVQFKSLKQLLARDSTQPQDLSTLLQNALQVFRALGVESQPFIIKRINQAIEENAKDARRQIQNDRLTPTAPLFPKETLDSIKKSWFNDGKAAGHYLLESLTKTQPELHKALFEWEENDPAPPNRILPPFGLWGNDPVYETPPEVLKLFGETNPRWKHPFGPRKAEDDPRLPLKAGKSDLRPAHGLFWDEHPLLTTVLSLEPCFVTAPPGSGASAMLRMGRHIRRFWGRKPALSLGLSLSGKAEMSALWHSAERALSEALRRDLVEAPYWLLSANAFTQEWVKTLPQALYALEGKNYVQGKLGLTPTIPGEERESEKGAIALLKGRDAENLTVAQNESGNCWREVAWALRDIAAQDERKRQVKETCSQMARIRFLQAVGIEQEKQDWKAQIQEQVKRIGGSPYWPTIALVNLAWHEHYQKDDSNLPLYSANIREIIGKEYLWPPQIQPDKAEIQRWVVLGKLEMLHCFHHLRRWEDEQNANNLHNAMHSAALSLEYNYRIGQTSHDLRRAEISLETRFRASRDWETHLLPLFYKSAQTLREEFNVVLPPGKQPRLLHWLSERFGDYELWR